MSRLFAASVVLAAFAFSADGAPKLIEAGEGMDFAVPEGSGLAFVKLSGPFGTAIFKGRITLSGTYTYGRMAGYPGDDAIGLTFIPDAQDAARLPYWHQDGVMKELRFQNPKVFIQAVIPAGLARAVERGGRNSVRGLVSINAQGFEATVICGGAIYLTRFQSVAVKPTLLAHNGTQSRTTC